MSTHEQLIIALEQVSAFAVLQDDVPARPWTKMQAAAAATALVVL